MSAWSRLALGATAFALVTFAASAHAAPSASMEQVRNGQATATTTPLASWGTGNAGSSNSHYLESHSIGYRSVMDGLPTDGTVVELTLGYDVKRSGSYALDYLTQYHRLLPHVTFAHRDPEVFDPLDGVTGISSLITTAPIPLPTKNLLIDPDGAESDPAALQPMTSMGALPDSERVMTLFGGTLLDVTYVTEAKVDLVTKSSETQVKVRFIPNGPKAVLAWGGHIASRWEWGFNTDGSPRSAGGISGSSYHMRLIGWNLGSLGSMDRSMSTDAVYPVPRCMITPQGPFCAGTTQTHTAPSGMETYSWSLTDNTAGAFFVGGTTGTSVTVQTTQGGSYTIVLTTGASGFSKSCQATITVNAQATSAAGPDFTACSTSPAVQLSGSFSGGNPAWQGGAGTFAPGRTDPNATYTPTAAEILSGVTLTLVVTPGTGPCPAASDAVRLTWQPAATANAGADQTVCATGAVVQLAGSVGGSASGGTWSGGAGVFTPSASALNATYTPTAGEIAAGGVTLTLTTNDPVGPCGPFSDTVHITIPPAATADAGLDRTVCASAPQVQLAGAVGGAAATGTWSGGAGTFAPNASTLNATYTPSAGEIAAGGVTLTLTTNDPAGPCGAVADQVRITIDPAATVNAGLDLVSCASSPSVQLAGVLGGAATGGTWSGGTGSYAPSPNVPNPTYTPSPSEIAAGSVTLTYTTNDPAGPCGAVSDQVKITINPVAIVNAGPDQIVCANSPQAQLAGTASGSASGATWSGGAGSFSPNASNLNARYTPSAGEIAAGFVVLTLTTNDPAGPCGPVSDQVRITIDPLTVVNAGADQVVCASAPQVQLNGSVTGVVTTGSWSGGTGTYSPSANALNATYTPSAAEIAAGGVTLTLTSSTSSRPCPPASDQVRITINVAATANAGADLITCATSPTVQLSATVGGSASSGAWTGGTGTFVPGRNVPNPQYTPSPGEIAAGSVTLTWTSNDPTGPCPPVSDQVKITYDQPTVSVTDKIVCSGIRGVTLCASAGNGVSPYTYRWSNGATTQCIAVSDTGRYSVTITDAKGCTATGSGVFRWRDCIGELTHTSATCGTYQAGTSDQLMNSDINYAVSNGVISNISPGVFFYWSKVTAAKPNFRIDVRQIKTNPAFPFIDIMQGQIKLYDANCNDVTDGYVTGPGQGSIDVTGAQGGQVFIVNVKYQLKSLIGAPMPPGSGCRFDFLTQIDGVTVDTDPDGITIGTVAVTGVGGGPEIDPGTVELYRPMPNPFRDGTHMAYAVNQPVAHVDIRVFDLAGRVVRTLENGDKGPGRYLVSWDGRDDQGARIRSGMYFLRASIGGQQKKVTVTMVK